MVKGQHVAPKSVRPFRRTSRVSIFAAFLDYLVTEFLKVIIVIVGYTLTEFVNSARLPMHISIRCFESEHSHLRKIHGSIG